MRRNLLFLLIPNKNIACLVFIVRVILLLTKNKKMRKLFTKHLFLGSIASMVMLFFTTIEAKACISDTITNIDVMVNYVDYDSAGCTYIGEIEIKLSNLKLTTQEPGKVCACALNSLNLYGDILYIAFVEAGTTTPYQGFASYNQNLASTLAWGSQQPGFGGWAGYVSTLINGGLSADDEVELIIRAKPTRGAVSLLDSCDFTSASLIQVVQSTTLGTDEWSESGDSLVNDHQKTRGLTNIMMISERDSSYFATLDSMITNNIATQEPTLPDGIASVQNANVSVYPNPFSKEVHFVFNTTNINEKSTLRIMNLNGQIIKEVNVSNEKQFTFTTDVKGVYFYSISSNEGVIARGKILKN